MNVFIATPYLPYPDAPHATAEAIFRFIYQFSRRHRIWLASMYEPSEVSKLDAIKRYADVVCTVMSRESSISAHLQRRQAFESSGLFSTLRAAVSGAQRLLSATPKADEAEFIQSTLEQISRLKPDIVQVETAHLSRLMSKHLERLPAVAVAHDVDMKPAYRRFEQAPLGLKKMIYYGNYRLLSLAEPRAYKRYRRLYTVSAFDKAYLLRHDSSLNIGERPSIFMLPEPSEHMARNRQMILFLGAMHRPENIEAALFFISKVLPLVQASNPDSEFHLVGGGAPEHLQQLHDGKTIFIHGFVKSAMPYFKQARVMVAPMFVGGGMIMKVFYALHYGLPTVASPIANEGIGATHDESIFIAQTPNDFARHIQTMLSDDDAWRRISHGATAFIAKRFNQDTLIEQLEADYAEIISSHRQ